MKHQKLIIMRHGKAEVGTAEQSDFERPLAARGRRDAANMARWLAQQDFAPTCVKTSPAVRAAETARTVAEELGGLPVISEDSLYLADLVDLLEVVRQPPSACWLLVGHNPGLEMLVNFCDPGIDRRCDNAKLMPTAAIYAFSISAKARTLATGCGSLLCHQRPKLLD